MISTFSLGLVHVVFHFIKQKLSIKRCNSYLSSQRKYYLTGTMKAVLFLALLFVVAGTLILSLLLYFLLLLLLALYVCLFDLILYVPVNIFSYVGTRLLARERSGSVVECLTRDRGAAGSSFTGVTALWSLSKTHLS